MELQIQMLGNKRVSATFDGLTVMTDQPKDSGGEGTAPAPFDLFLASIGTCAGFFIQSFCQARQLDSSKIKITQSVKWNDESHHVDEIQLKIDVPADFPEKYLPALLKTVDSCTVKKHLAAPPQIKVMTAKID